MNKEKTNNGKNFAGSFASGIVGGVAAGLITPVQAFPQESPIIEEPVQEEEPIEVEPVDDGLMDVATGIDDSMSFGQAFAAARAEVGPGGLFVWHGNTYGTYYKEEWDAMSAEDKEQYWANVHHTTAHLNDLSAATDDDADVVVEEEYADVQDDTVEDNDWDENLDENPDVDLLASNDLDPDIPIDNNMDMSAFA